MTSVSLRLANASDGAEVLAFCRAQGFRPRDLDTWTGLRMTAALAERDGAIVGAIPVEPRWLRVGTRRVLAWHETMVALGQEFRGRGLGSALQDLLRGAAACDVLTVYREDPASGAHRWYTRNGFAPVMRIDGCLGMPSAGATSGWRHRPWDDPEVPWDWITGLDVRRGARGMFVEPATRPLRAWLAHHPYRNTYRFSVTWREEVGYAVLGTGQLYSNGARVEIMDRAGEGEERALAREAFAAAAAVAGAARQPLRWAVTPGDPAHGIAEAGGLAVNWTFDLMASPVRLDVRTWLDAVASVADPRYRSLDYI